MTGRTARAETPSRSPAPVRSFCLTRPRRAPDLTSSLSPSPGQAVTCLSLNGWLPTRPTVTASTSSSTACLPTTPALPVPAGSKSSPTATETTSPIAVHHPLQLGPHHRLLCITHSNWDHITDYCASPTPTGRTTSPTAVHHPLQLGPHCIVLYTLYQDTPLISGCSVSIVNTLGRKTYMTLIKKHT